MLLHARALTIFSIECFEFRLAAKMGITHNIHQSFFLHFCFFLFCLLCRFSAVVPFAVIVSVKK